MVTSPEMRNRPAGQRDGLGKSSSTPTTSIIQAASLMPPAALIAEVQIWAASVGFICTRKCTRCGAPLYAAASLARGIGPKCSKAVGK